MFCIEFVREILLGGVKTIVVFTSWDFVGDNKWAVWPALPWTVVSGGVMLLGYALRGKALAAFGRACDGLYSYIWTVGAGDGDVVFCLNCSPCVLLVGSVFWVRFAYKNKAAETILMPLLNVAQTMPHFSYLIPVMVFFGVGDHAGAIATIIFATPPMIRLTLLGLKRVSLEVIEAGAMNGLYQCSDDVEGSDPNSAARYSDWYQPSHHAVLGDGSYCLFHWG